MDPFRKYIITQIIKQTGKIPRADTVLSNKVAQLKMRIKNMGVDISKVTDPKEITKYFNMEKSWFNQILKQKAKNLGLFDPNKNIFMKKGPFEGFKPKVVPKPKDIKSKLEKQNKESIQRWKDKVKKDPPEDLAYGGLAGLLGERTGYQWGKRAYKSREDIPKDVLAMLEKDPNFDLETFLKDVEWSHPDQTYLQLALAGETDALSSWGHYDPETGKILLNYQKFGKSEPIAGGMLGFKKPKDADKVKTILHELRHKKFAEPWFRKSSAVPKYVRKEKRFYSDEDEFGKLLETPYKETLGEELYTRFLDQRFGVLPKKGDIMRSDYEPYFDQILKKHWEPHAKAYENIIREEKRVKSKPYGLAGGGLAGMLGEPTYQDDNHRVPLKKGKTPFKPPLPDENILEGLWKNMGPWQKVLWGLGLSPFEKGGRVGLWQGGLAAALRFLMQKYGKDVIKLAKDVKPSKKWDTQKAIQEFKKRNPQFKAEGGRTGFYLGGPAWKKFMEGLFLKASNDIRQGKGLFKGLSQNDWIKLHDDLTKKLVEFQKGGYKRIPKGMKKFFDMNDIQIMNKYKVITGQIKPSFSLSREKLMNRFPNMTKQQVDELMGKTADEQKEALDQLMKLEKFNPVIKHAEGGIVSLNAGGPLNTQALIQLYMAEGMTEEEAEAAASASANLPWNILTEKAEGGRVGMLWGGGVWKTIIQNLARAKGVTPSDYLKITNWKALPKEVRNLMSKVDFEKMKQGRIEMFENWVDMAKTRMNFLKNIKEGKKTQAAPIFEHLEKSFKSPVPGKVSQKDILQGEYILKNLKTKGRKLNAEGGLARMLGE